MRALRLSDVDSMSGTEFEVYVATLLEHLGFQTSLTSASGDLGVDIIAERDDIRYAVQCKRQSGDISRHAVSDAVAGIAHYRCTQAMVVTNRYFRKGALDLADSADCRLVDRDEFANWILSFRGTQKPASAPKPLLDRLPGTVDSDYWVVLDSGPLAGRRFPVAPKLEIGRDSSGIRLPFDRRASRHHAEFAVTGSGLVVRDLGSTNGTLLNGATVDEALVSHGDVVMVGSTPIRVE